MNQQYLKRMNPKHIHETKRRTDTKLMNMKQDKQNSKHMKQNEVTKRMNQFNQPQPIENLT